MNGLARRRGARGELRVVVSIIQKQIVHVSFVISWTPPAVLRVLRVSNSSTLRSQSRLSKPLRTSARTPKQNASATSAVRKPPPQNSVRLIRLLNRRQMTTLPKDM